MNLNLLNVSKHSFALSLSALLLLAGLETGWAQTTTVTSNPQDGATGVSVSAPVVFTFSAAVDPASTTVSFLSTNPPGAFPVTSAWNSGDTVLTCTPMSPFPGNANIEWIVIDFAAGVFAQGSFSTGTNSTTGGGGSGTNAITTFSVGKFYINEQSSAGAPTPDALAAYGFFASTSLSSNRTANTIAVTLPSGAVSNLVQDFSRREVYTAFGFDTNNTRFETTFAEGNYLFNVTAATSNQQVTVVLPTSMPQPNAPHISNFTNAQSIDVTKPFTLTWDAFQGGTAADAITVSVIGYLGTNLFQTPSPGTNGALSGTATSATIPAGKLPANSTNTTTVVFYHFQTTSNANYATFAYRATGTQLEMNTIGSGGGAPPIVGNPGWSGANFGFDVKTSPNQALKVLYSPDCSVPASMWQTIFTTNSPGTDVHITVPRQVGAAGFFRLENGP